MEMSFYDYMEWKKFGERQVGVQIPLPHNQSTLMVCYKNSYFASALNSDAKLANGIKKKIKNLSSGILASLTGAHLSCFGIVYRIFASPAHNIKRNYWTVDSVSYCTSAKLNHKTYFFSEGGALNNVFVDRQRDDL